MSFPKRRLIVAEDAQQDIRSLLLYSEEQWGHKQRYRYQLYLDRAFALIHSNPLIGLPREDLGRGLRTRVVERHVIFYRVEHDVVRVLRIVHQRNDPDSQLFEVWEGK